LFSAWHDVCDVSLANYLSTPVSVAKCVWNSLPAAVRHGNNLRSVSIRIFSFCVLVIDSVTPFQSAVSRMKGTKLPLTAILLLTVKACSLTCIGYTRTKNVNDGKRPKHDEVYVDNSKRRSEWHLFSLADWIWTWQFANGWTVSFSSGIFSFQLRVQLVAKP